MRVFGVGVVEGDAGLWEEGEAARERVLEFYHRRAWAADGWLRWLPGMPVPERFSDRAAALAWLDAERAGLVAAVQWARQERYADTAVWLSQCLAEFLDWRRFFDDKITVCGVAREAAHRAGNQAGEAGAWNSLGIALRETGRTVEAIDAHTRSRDLHHAAGDSHREAFAWGDLGVALREAGRAEEAIDAHTRSRDLHQTLRNRHGEAIAWNNLGSSLGDTGRAEEAIEAFEKALERYREFEDWYGTGQTCSNLALAHQYAARPSDAHTCYLQSADAFTRANAPTEAAKARTQAEAITP
ncbi:tetratricopeptide repeat protein [Streptomyces sp. NPDC050548]|uniref:tetratricopeptide repeat protein n=1 Tax=Streptomyces sp. NPDC050548 TaxID=3365629 RepID=UPI0037BA5B5C